MADWSRAARHRRGPIRPGDRGRGPAARRHARRARRADGVLAAQHARAGCCCGRAASGISTPPGVHTLDAYRRGRARSGRPDPDRDVHRVRGLVRGAEGSSARERVNTLVAAERGGFEARMADGSTILADRVVAAPGIAHFAVEPALVRGRLAPSQWSHTSRTVEFEGLRGRRCLIVGGRQSAFEWAALLAEEGAARVDVVHRHDTPEFTGSDWSFVDDMLAHTRADARLVPLGSPDERARGDRAALLAGRRLQLEPWLAADRARQRPPVAARGARGIDIEPGEAITVTLGDGTRLETDHVLLATGYRVDMRRVPYLPETSRWPTASRCSTRTSSPASRASTSPAFPRRATSARSSASWPGRRRPPRSSAPRSGRGTVAGVDGAGRSWTDIYDTLTRADRAEDLERLATAAYMLGRDEEYCSALERAHHAHLEHGAGLPAAAARCGSGSTSCCVARPGGRRAGWAGRNGWSSVRRPSASSTGT